MQTRLLTAGVASVVCAILVAVLLLGVNSGSAQTPTLQPTVIAEDVKPVASEDVPAEDMPSPEDVKVAFPVVGAPAIPARQSVKEGGPVFSTDDVIAYLRTHSYHIVSPTAPRPTVTNVEFVTAREAGEIIRGALQLPDDHIVCVVTVTGYLSVAEEITGATGYVVFDASTGNLLNETLNP